MKSIFNKERLIFGVLLVALILVGEVVFHHFSLAAWPAFMVMVFFLLGGSDLKNAPAILIGGLFGILCILLLELLVTAVGPAMGIFPAKLLFVGLFVMSIVLFKDALSFLFNDYAFMYFLVSSVAAANPNPSPLQWSAVELIGGAIFIAGILGIRKLLAPAPDEHISLSE